MNENRKKVIDIHNSLVALPADLNLVEPHRIFVLQGVLTKVCRKQPKKFTFFLFSDLLLYADNGLGDKYVVCMSCWYNMLTAMIDTSAIMFFIFQRVGLLTRVFRTHLILLVRRSRLPL